MLPIALISAYLYALVIVRQEKQGTFLQNSVINASCLTFSEDRYKSNDTSPYSKSPDDDIFRHLALTYSKFHPTMHIYNETKCSGSERGFEDGITNGADWYPMKGKSSLSTILNSSMHHFLYLQSYSPGIHYSIQGTCVGTYDNWVFSNLHVGNNRMVR